MFNYKTSYKFDYSIKVFPAFKITYEEIAAAVFVVADIHLTWYYMSVIYCACAVCIEWEYVSTYSIPSVPDKSGWYCVVFTIINHKKLPVLTC